MRKTRKMSFVAAAEILFSLGFAAFLIGKDFLGIQVKGWQCPTSIHLMSNQHHGEKSRSGELFLY